MKSVAKQNRKAKLVRAADAAGRVRIEDCRCASKGHEQRTAAVTSMRVPLCWECYLGAGRFEERFEEQAEGFYRPGGPGWAGD